MRKSTYLELTGLLRQILKTLEEMKEQEKQYWETWKIAKMRENI